MGVERTAVVKLARPQRSFPLFNSVQSSLEEFAFNDDSTMEHMNISLLPPQLEIRTGGTAGSSRIPSPQWGEPLTNHGCFCRLIRSVNSVGFLNFAAISNRFRPAADNKTLVRDVLLHPARYLSWVGELVIVFFFVTSSEVTQKCNYYKSRSHFKLDSSAVIVCYVTEIPYLSNFLSAL